jgi:hypothetical protein
MINNLKYKNKKMGTVISRRRELFVKVVNGKFENRLDYSQDSGLGGAILRMTFMYYDNFSDIIFNDKRIRKIQVEINLKSGYLSWRDIMNELESFRRDYKLYRGDLEGFDIIEEDAFISKKIYIEPLLGT